MILLDTDHLSVLMFPDRAQHAGLVLRMESSADDEFGTTIVCVEEQMRGWLAYLQRARSIRQQTIAYDRLLRLFEFFAEWTILPFDDRSASEFERLRKRVKPVGAMDLKIAAIALANGAVLLSANRKDFERIPGLTLDCWIQ